jgi:hypothetical protein
VVVRKAEVVSGKAAEHVYRYGHGGGGHPAIVNRADHICRHWRVRLHAGLLTCTYVAETACNVGKPYRSHFMIEIVFISSSINADVMLSWVDEVKHELRGMRKTSIA